MKYKMSWINKDGTKYTNQIYTAEHITHQLKSLEEWGASHIVIKSIEPDDKDFSVEGEIKR